MSTPIVDQVVDFYYALLDRIFSEPFRLRIPERLKRDAVIRQVQDSAGAASQSLTRFLLNEQLTEQQVANILAGLATLGDRLRLDDIANPNVAPEEISDALLPELPCPEVTQQAGHAAIHRLALHSVVQVLMLIGPVMAEWQKLSFSSSFELPRRVVNRLNQISEQLDTLGRSGQAAVDERYELSYRDYLLQRFHRVEAGTVRMTTSLDVDLRELFVIPRVLARPLAQKAEDGEPREAAALMDLAAARRFFAPPDERGVPPEPGKDKDPGIPALEHVQRYPRNVISGVPGSGKSTFLEWLQLKIAGAEEELLMADEQAIPLLLRVRELDPHDLPLGAALIEKATASRDIAVLMPHGWIDRQMRDGRVLFMLDGLDETEPDLRDRYVLPWIRELGQRYPNCRYLVSSRPVGYPPGALRTLQFAECDLLDFGDDEIAEYTRHWCTAVRLARNEPGEEARREGAADGERIVAGFKGHPYIRDLARNPLMLSAICLVNYFEGGQLPRDRAVLYALCVEGLLHHWDQRRGIHSVFGFDEKLRACREVALTMQADNLAEYEAGKVEPIFAAVLGDPARAKELLEHIRRRTGLLLERRSGIFAFAHLTFQEYLAARSIHEGNRLGIDAGRLVREHGDARWHEVIALYSGLAPTPAVRDMIERLIDHPDTLPLSTVLAEAYLLAGPELSQDRALRRRILERIAIAPAGRWPSSLERFPAEEVAPIAALFVGKGESEDVPSEAHHWLAEHPERLDTVSLAQRLREWRKMKPAQAADLIHLLHAYGQGSVLAELATDAAMYSAPGPRIGGANIQAEIALIGLSRQKFEGSASTAGVDAALLQILRTLSDPKYIMRFVELYFYHFSAFLERRRTAPPPQDSATWPEFSSLARQLAERLAETRHDHPARESAIAALNAWASALEHAIAEKKGQRTKFKSASRSQAATTQRAKKKPSGGTIHER